MNVENMLQGSSVLVTGGTGFTGSHLVEKLVEMDLDVRMIVRNPAKVDESISAKVQFFQGDVYDQKLIERAADGVHYIFHLAACYRDAGADDQEYHNVHVKSTQLLAQSAVNNPEFKRFVHTSTIGVHGHIKNPPANETSEFNPGDIYQETKVEGELWIREFAKNNELSLAVIRPAAIMGPDDRRLLKLFKFAKYGIFPLVDGHRTLYHLIHVDDLTDCMLLASVHPKAEGEVFICGNEKPTDVVEMLNIIGGRMDKKVRFIKLPSGPLFFITDLVESLSKSVGVEPIIYRRRLEFFTKDRAFDTSKVRNVLDFQTKYTNDTALEHTARGYASKDWI